MALPKIFRIIKYILWRLRFVFLIILLIAGAIFTYFYTNIFNYKEILINSSNKAKLQYINAEDLKTKLEWVYSQKYFSTKLNEVNTAILDNPFAESVLVTKIFPNTLVVYINERNPFVSVEIDKRQCILLSREGWVLAKQEDNCDATNKKYVPIKVYTDDPKLDFLVNYQSTYYQINEIEKIIKVLTYYKLGVERIDIEKGVAKISLTKKRKIIFSFNQDIEIQLYRLSAILPEIENNRIKYSQIDVRYNRPVVKK